jgi:hypothetical protein
MLLILELSRKGTLLLVFGILPPWHKQMRKPSEMWEQLSSLVRM